MIRGETARTGVAKEVIGTIASLSLTMLGVGALAIPYTIRVAGLGGGLAILCVVACVSLFSMNVVIEAGMITGGKSYQATASHEWILGKRLGGAVMQLTFLLTLFGVLVVMLPLVCDNLEPLTRHLDVPRHWMLAIVAIGESILSLPRSFSALKWTSLAGIACLWFMLIVILRVAVGRGQWPPSDPNFASSTASAGSISGIAQAISIQGLSFGTHINLNAAFAELSPAAREYKNTICVSVILLGLVFYVALGISGWACFDGVPEVDILSPGNNFAPYTTLADCVRVSMACVLLLKTPLLVQPLREITESVVEDVANLWRRQSPVRDDEMRSPLLLDDEEDQDAESASIKFYSVSNIIITFVLFGAALIVCETVSDLGILTALVGATGVVLLIYTVPGIFLFKLPAAQKLNREQAELPSGMPETAAERKRATAMRIVAGMLIAFSLGVCIMAMLAIFKWPIPEK